MLHRARWHSGALTGCCTALAGNATLSMCCNALTCKNGALNVWFGLKLCPTLLPVLSAVRARLRRLNQKGCARG
eukprot:NODE_14432_length_232_cov_1.491525.p2 GENE.NODE_14432_length_232_cov_1.491525~~NODE_14432_length_232_cov_1.491525.p2  ORF type:complete len:74 (+),score=4.03 NODE_14432_length_232_cov_1.491525:3-224(+)